MARTGPITREDIEAGFRSLQGDVDDTVESAKGTAVAVGAGAVVLLILLAFIFGRKRGNKRTAYIEIRRV